jgi:Electron transfer DM13
MKWIVMIVATVAASALGLATTADAAGKPVARGKFVSIDNEPAAGNVALVRLASGKRVLRFTKSAIGPGPALRIYLVKGTVRGNKDVRTFRDLGPLKATTGSQSYAVPRRLDTRRFRSVVVWCADFSVAFGSALLKPVQ